MMEEADSSGSAVVVASNKSNECDDAGGHEGGSLSGRKFQVQVRMNTFSLHHPTSSQ